RSASSTAWPPTRPVAPVTKIVLGLAVSMSFGSRAILHDHERRGGPSAAWFGRPHPRPPGHGRGEPYGPERGVQARPPGARIVPDPGSPREWNSRTRPRCRPGAEM